ncbi:Transcriptional regulatory protein ZraR [Rubripirellula obstinata]|uniref:Transcriptional regulatory protein ZraR n=1 Tax=Rubripirellula obstinata TaxID=406547 RepID=A0A5B1CD33_9BACT|nr:sigma 54-interacting transcriptional regulator [Rubripirellula obstinata]KAA1258476.1 Transcriptional regulatory protein ZraR [Rubripirellula obstinata]
MLTDFGVFPLKPAIPALSAYLILRSAGRWSDVFRLAPPGVGNVSGNKSGDGVGEAVLGRSSSNQIVLQSERASRRHARIFWNSGDRDGEGSGWMIEDLGSRNGTTVNGKQIDSPVLLSDPSTIELAGFSITFSHRIDVGGIDSDGKRVSADASATSDDLTSEFDASAITDRRAESRYLDVADGNTHGQASQTSGRLLSLAFALARAADFDQVIERTLEAIDDHRQIDTAGVYAIREADHANLESELPLVGTRQHGPRSYRRAPESLIAIVSADGGQATLARNVLGDSNLATENSRGEIEVESLILAPVRSSDGKLIGLIHLTTTAEQPPLNSDDLEFIVAVAQILSESLRGVHQRSELNSSLKQSRRKVELLQQQVGQNNRMIGRSAVMVEVANKIKLAAPTSATVLVRGESGVGKELVASAIHHASDRSEGPLVCLNCAALSPTLLESELFGHEKGAFTGATDKKTGKFEAADTGTLMLDEIGEMSADIQAKFLRVLEGHAFERVGGNKSIKVDVRVVAATNRDLQAMVAEGKFRQDLFYRLNVVEIVVPPLRSRPEDVMLLAKFFLDRFKKETGRKIDGFTDQARNQLTAYHWPGNVRELKNVIERAVVLNTTNSVDSQHLMLTATSNPSSSPDASTSATGTMTIAELEQSHIEQVLRQTGGNKSQAAKVLGIERSTLDRKLKRWANQ